MSKNEISHIVNGYKNIKLPLFVINKFFDTPATSIAVERSFSLCGKMLQDDRPFNEENIKYYIVSLYNKLQIIENVSENEEIEENDLTQMLEYLLSE